MDKNKGKEIKRGKYRNIGIAVFILFLAAVLVLVEKADIYGDSMSPSLLDGDCVLVEKLSYLVRKPRRFDMVVFRYRDENEYYTKRIIGLPEETVQIIDGEVYINGERLEEPEKREKILEPGRAENPIVLGEDEYFLLGDNRNHSADSRNSDIGNVKKSRFRGRVFLRLPR